MRHKMYDVFPSMGYHFFKFLLFSKVSGAKTFGKNDDKIAWRPRAESGGTDATSAMCCPAHGVRLAKRTV